MEMYCITEMDGEIVTEEWVENNNMEQYCYGPFNLVEAINKAVETRASDRFTEITTDYLKSEIDSLKKEIEQLKRRL